MAESYSLSQKSVVNINRDQLISGLFLLCFYVVTAGLYPLTVPDEGRYPSIALAMLQRKDYINTMLNGGLFIDKPVLFYWLEALSMSVLGVNEWSIRLPVILTGIFAVLLTQRVTTIFYGRRTGWLAALILGTSLLYYASSHYAAMDLEVAVWVSGSLFFALLGLQHPAKNKRRMLFYTAYFFAALAMLTKGLIGILFPAMILGLYSLLSGRWQLIKMIFLPSGLCIFFVLCAPWFILMQIKHPFFFHYFFVYQHFIRFTHSGFNNSLPFWFYLPVVFFGLFPWSFFIINAIKDSLKSYAKDQVAFYCGIWVLAIFIFFSIPDSKPVTYIMPVFPPLALLLAKETDKWLNKKALCIVSCVLSVIILLAGLAILLCTLLKWLLPSSLQQSFYLAMVAVILIIGAITTLTFSLKKCRTAIFTTVTTALILILILAANIAGQFNQNSSRSLALLVKNKITPETQIINYRRYYYDLPLYLQNTQPIKVVYDWRNEKKILHSDNWKHELYLGMQYTPEAKKNLILPAELRSVLKKPSYLFTHIGYVDELLNNYPLSLISTSGNIALLSNHNMIP